LVSTVNGSVFNFNSASLSLTLEQPLGQSISDENLLRLADQADLLTGIVLDNLNLSEFAKISTSVSCTYSCSGKEDAERWIMGLKAWEISDKYSSAFGGNIEAATAMIAFVGDDRKYQLKFSVIEKQPQLERGANSINIRTNTLSRGQDKAFKKRLLEKHTGLKHPIFASLIEVDAYQEDPISVDIHDYITTSVRNSLQNLNRAVAKL